MADTRPRSPASATDLWLIGLGCLALTAALYYPTLRFYFVGDDVAFVNPYPGWLRAALLPSPFWHYYPLNQFLLHVLPALSGRRPEVMHVLNLLLHAGAGVGLTLLLRRLGVDRVGCVVASLFFVSRGIGYEVVTWITELSYLSVVVYTLLTLHWWDRYLRGKGTRYLGWTVVGFAAAVLTIEHALLLLPLYFLYEVIIQPAGRSWLHWPWSAAGRREGWVLFGQGVLRGGRKYVPLVLVVAAFVSVKVATHGGLTWTNAATASAAAPVPSGEQVTTRLASDRTWHGILNTPRRAYLDLLLSASYLFFPIGGCYAAEESWLTRDPWLYLLPWLVVHVWVVWKGRPVTRFLLAWVYLYMLPLAVAGVPQARYYYMAMLPAAGLVGVAWGGVWNWLARWVRGSLLVALTVALLGGLIYGEASFIRARQQEWKLASDLVRRSLTLLDRDLTQQVRRVLMVNFPFGVPSSFWPGWAFNNAAFHLHRMLHPPRTWVEMRVVYDRSLVGERWATIGEYAAAEKIREELGQPGVIGYEFLGRPPWIKRLP